MSARYLQNSFVPVNHLPPEVLGLIPSSFLSKRGSMLPWSVDIGAIPFCHLLIYDVTSSGRS